jgi:hypothetical protein
MFLIRYTWVSNFRNSHFVHDDEGRMVNFRSNAKHFLSVDAAKQFMTDVMSKLPTPPRGIPYIEPVSGDGESVPAFTLEP